MPPAQEPPKDEPTGTLKVQPSQPADPSAAAAVGATTGLSDLLEQAAVNMKEPELKPSDIPGGMTVPQAERSSAR
eukprot:2653015-Karenia_brevis.AAC.1